MRWREFLRSELGAALGLGLGLFRHGNGAEVPSGTPETLTDGGVSAATLTDGGISAATLEDRA